MISSNIILCLTFDLINFYPIYRNRIIFQMQASSNVINHVIEVILGRVMQRIVAVELREKKSLSLWSENIFNNLFSLDHQKQPNIKLKYRLSQDNEPIHSNCAIKSKLVKSLSRLQSNFSRSQAQENQNKRPSLPSKQGSKQEENEENICSDKKLIQLPTLKLNKNKSNKSTQALKIEQSVEEANNQKWNIYLVKQPQSLEAKQINKQKQFLKPNSLEYRISLQRKFKLKFSRSPELKLRIKKPQNQNGQQLKQAKHQIKVIKKKQSSQKICSKQEEPINCMELCKIPINQSESSEKKVLISKRSKTKKDTITIMNREIADQMFLETCVDKVLKK